MLTVMIESGMGSVMVWRQWGGCLGAVMLTLACVQADEGGGTGAGDAVTLDTYIRAQTDHHFQRYADDGYFGTLRHDRAPLPADADVLRPNRDVLHSVGLFDLSSPVTISTQADPTRLQSLQVVSQDHFTPLMVYGGREITLDQDTVGSRYALVMVRTQVDADSPEDIAKANAQQDAIEWSQAEQGEMTLPDWDVQALADVREAVLGLSPFLSGSHRMFGAEGDVDPVRHLWGTAAGWLGQPIEEAYYVTINPLHNDGDTPQVLMLPVDVPVTGFWSVTVYDDQGRLIDGADGAQSVTSSTADANEDGSVTLHFGGDPDVPNYLAIEPGWNYTLRFYRPTEALTKGEWLPPSPTPVGLPVPASD
ncbi:DUF1214 domain-containing protein [Halomonas sp. DP8Y7-3]|uniref:DUF1214 domain-containing protein n=1 Tax=Halomonas sp. DP8Y7-3 TaxID=2859079 RepID=UPI001C9713A7|nr:DUF1214 domain-containing protein [Halomonas sp. DP8Y7-3]MBY5931157.1 DUF1214 domain-containing protein [Halomonas sp. DP8Y7-3]